VPEGRPSLAQRFSVCVRTGFWAIRWNEELENSAPEGRTNLAQRFSAGKSGKSDLSPGGTTQFSRTHFSAAMNGLAQRHSRIGTKIHSHKFPPQKFRKGRDCNHRRVVGGKCARWKENRQSLHPRFALKRRPQFPIGGHTAANKKSSNVISPRRRQRLHDQIVDHGALKRSHQVKELPVREPANIFKRRRVDARKRLSASLNRRFQVLGLDVSQNRRLDSAVGKIKARPTNVRPILLSPMLRTIAQLVIAPVRVLDLRNLELDRPRIAMRCEPINDGSSGIAKSQKLRDFIERLSGGVVASVADVPVGPEIFLHLGKIKMRVAARDNQREHREMQVAILALPLLKQYGVDVSLKMVHGDQWLLQPEGQRLGIADANQQSARQSRTLRDRNGIDGLISLSRFGQSLAHHRNNRAQVLARGQFRNHSAIRLVRGDLRGNDVRQNPLPRAHHGRARLITGAFDAEDACVRHNELSAVSHQLSVSSLDDLRLMLLYLMADG